MYISRGYFGTYNAKGVISYSTVEKIEEKKMTVVKKSVPMNFFSENMMSDVLLTRLGIDCSESRSQLIEFFDTAFRFVSNERGAVLSDFLQKIETMHSRAASERVLADGLMVDMLNLEAGNAVLIRRVDGLLAELDVVSSKAQSSELRCAELVVINEKQIEGIAAFKEKVKGLKTRLVESGAMITKFEAERVAANAQILALETLCGDIRTANVLLDQRLVMVEKEALVRSKSLISVRLRVSLRQLATCRRDLANARGDWSKWYKRTASVPGGRCGCVKSIQHFKRSGIDLDWIQAEAERASKGFERELKETADDFREQVSVVRKERDDALADNEVYIDQVLAIRREMLGVQQSRSAGADELSATKAELARRITLERFARLQVLIGADGREKICPIPTLDGILVPALDVYRGWMAGCGGEGLDLRFECPVSGAVSSVLCLPRVSDAALSQGSRLRLRPWGRSS
jgi:hypothetical protein